MEPLVTVIMGAYDAQAYVAAALASVREQSLRDFRVLVVDAGSVDATVDVVAACVAQDDRFTLIRSPERRNCPQARNVALASVSTPFVATLDNDDTMSPGRLAEQLDFMARHPDAVAVGGGLLDVDSNGMPVMRPRPSMRPRTPAEVSYAMPFFSPFLASAGFFRTDALIATGGFDEEHEHADDYATVWNLTTLGEVWRMPRYVGTRRHHPGQISSRKRHTQRLEVALMRRRIAESISGGPIRLSSVMLWTSTFASVRDDVLEAARADLRRYHGVFSHARDLDAPERAWIDEFYVGRLEHLQGFGGRVVTTSSATTRLSSRSV